MTQALAHNFTTMMRYKERLFVLLVGCVVVTACAYAFLLQKAVVNVVEREQIVRDIALRSTHVSELESKYLSLKSAVTMELAHTKGFQDVPVSNYISKKSVTAMISTHEL